MENNELNREISKTPNCPTMDPGLISGLTNLCFQQAQEVPADVLFVFGSNVKHQEIAGVIGSLLDRNLVNRVIITGGVANYGGSFYQHKPESESIFSFLSEDQRKGKQIQLENQSRNTLENVTEAIKHFSFEGVKRIAFLCHSYASTRSALCLQRFFPDTELFCIPFSLPSDQPQKPVNSLTWHQTRYGQSLVLGEYLRLMTYGKRGDFPTENIQDLLNKVQHLMTIKKH